MFLGSGNLSLGMQVCVEVEESYKIAVPEIAGFISTAGAAGTLQQLNLRKHKYQVFSVKERGSNNYSVSNEVNPLAESAVSAQNQ